jgi:hypothetical protein
MFRRNNKTRKYQAPAALVTPMALESNFCATVRFNVQVKELENMNDPEDALKGIGDAAEEVFYFES